MIYSSCVPSLCLETCLNVDARTIPSGGMRVKGLTLVVHSHSRTAISIAHGLAKRGWREVSFGEKGERRSARSPPYPARSLPRACRRGQMGRWIGPHPRIKHGAGSSPRIGVRGRLSPRTGEGMGGGRGGFTAEGAESAEGEEGLAFIPVSSTGQALGPVSEYGAGSLPGRERGWERKRAGNVASRCILLHFRLLLSSCEALE